MNRIMTTAIALGLAATGLAATAQAQTPGVAATVPPLPRPVLEYVGQQPMTGSDGNPYIRYAFRVTNRDQYAPELFTLNSSLPPCGSNANAGRTWLDMYRAGGTSRLYGYCAMTSRNEMGDIGFQLPVGTAPPASIYIMLTDRLTNRNAASNNAAIPIARRPVTRPRPIG